MRGKNSFLGRILALILLTSLFILCAVSCGASKPAVRERYLFSYFNTDTVLCDYSGGEESDFDRRVGRVEEIFAFYHKLFDIYNEYEGINNIATLNRLAGRGAVSVPEELVDFLLFCKEMYSLTGGEVNVAFGAVLSIWHEHRTSSGEKTLPDMSMLSLAAEHCNIDDVVIDEVAGTVELVDPNMRLDVGAIAKGYAVERAAEYLCSDGAEGFVINAGGNLRAIGKKPDGTEWKSAVRNPDLTDYENRYVYTFFFSDSAAVTSGDYERYFVVDGVKYHHIIDKDTLMPSLHFSSVTVISPDSGMADALTTALFNMDYESGKALIESLGNTRAVWVTRTGEVLE